MRHSIVIGTTQCDEQHEYGCIFGQQLTMQSGCSAWATLIVLCLQKMLSMHVVKPELRLTSILTVRGAWPDLTSMYSDACYPSDVHAAGAVYDGKFFLISPNDDDTPDAMRVYDFSQREWALWNLPVTPLAAMNVLLGVHKDQLIQYGGQHT